MQSCCRCEQSELHSLDFLSVSVSDERQRVAGQHWAAKHSEVVAEDTKITSRYVDHDGGDTPGAICHGKPAKLKSVQFVKCSETETGFPRKAEKRIPPRRPSLTVAHKAKTLQVMQPCSRQPSDSCLSFCKLLWDKWSGNHRPSVRSSSAHRRSCRNSITRQSTTVLSNTPGECNRDLLKEATQQGRYVVAFGELLKLESKGGNPCEVLDESLVKRIRRIGQKLVDANRLFDLKPSDCDVQEKIEEAKLVWGMQIEGTYMRVAYTIDIDCDFLRALAFDSNMDLEPLVFEDEMQTKQLGEAHEHDATWHKFITSKIGTKSDDIIVQSCIDALDEPVGAICVMEYSLNEDETTTPSGVPVPPVEKSCSRCPYVLGAKSLVPLRAPDGRIHGVRRTQSVEIELPQIVASILGMMPSSLLKRLARGHFQFLARTVSAVINTSTQVSQCMQKQPRAAFYEQVRCHLGLPDEIDSAEVTLETATKTIM